LLAAIRERAAGETVLEAFKRFLLAPRGVFAKLEAGEADSAREQLRTVTRTITESPALLARERQVFSPLHRVASDPARGGKRSNPRRTSKPWVVANALLGVHRALIDYVRDRTLAGDDDPARLARALRAQGKRAFKRLETGLGQYAPATGAAADERAERRSPASQRSA
jgi:hypothetical protein